MIKQKATVIAVNETTVWLDTEHKSICSQCQVKQSCGTGLLEDHVGKRFSRIAVDKQVNVAVGKRVQLGIPEKSLLQGAFMMYIIPLMLMFLFAVVAHLLNFGEAVEFVTSICGLASGFYLVHIQFRNDKTGIQAEIVEE